MSMRVDLHTHRYQNSKKYHNLDTLMYNRYQLLSTSIWIIAIIMPDTIHRTLTQTIKKITIMTIYTIMVMAIVAIVQLTTTTTTTIIIITTTIY